MVNKITCLFLALAVACSYGGVHDPSSRDPGLSVALTAPARDDPVPKIEPLPLIRPQGFRGPSYNPGPGNVRFGANFGGGGYSSRPFYPGGFNPGRRPFGPGNLPPGRFTRPNGPGPGGYFPGNLPPGGFTGHGGFVPGNIPPGGIRGPTAWNQGFAGPVRPPIFNNRPPNYGPGQFTGYGGPYQQPIQERGPNIGPGGPIRPNFPQGPRANRPREKDQELDLDDLPEGTVGVTVTAVNQTDQGTVYAEITAFVVPNEETSPLDSRRNQNTAQNILGGLLNQGQRNEKKNNNNVEDILGYLNLPKR